MDSILNILRGGPEVDELDDIFIDHEILWTHASVNITYLVDLLKSFEHLSGNINQGQLLAGRLEVVLDALFYVLELDVLNGDHIRPIVQRHVFERGLFAIKAMHNDLFIEGSA